MLNPHKMKLGKQPYEQDPYTLAITEYISDGIMTPARFDFDNHRAAFPVNILGNDKWNNSVIVSQANHLLRMVRIEERRTLEIPVRSVNDRYKTLSGAGAPGDYMDKGISVLRAMKDWRTGVGWKVKGYTHHASAFGEIDPQDSEQLRRGIFALHGIHLGFWLPKAVQFMEDEWDYDGEKGDEWKPGSWGGQLAYAKAYAPGWIEIISWGQKFLVTNNFIDRYCDEAWAVIDNFEYWRVRQIIDVEKLTVAIDGKMGL